MSRVLMTLGTRSFFLHFPTSLETLGNGCRKDTRRISAGALPATVSHIRMAYYFHMAYYFSRLISGYNYLLVSNFDEFQGIFLFQSIVLSGAGFFFPGAGFFSRRRVFPTERREKKPGAGKKKPGAGKKNPAPESTMDQNRKIPWNSSKLDTIWVIARDEATKEIGHEHIIFPREDRGFRSNYEQKDQ